jgi:hypothetical protein
MLLGAGKPIEFVAAELKTFREGCYGSCVRTSNIAQTQTEAESEGGMTMRGFTDSRSYQLFGSRFRSKCTAQDRRQTAGAGKAQRTDGMQSRRKGQRHKAMG